LTLIITNYLLVASAPAGRNPFEKGLSSTASPLNPLRGVRGLPVYPSFLKPLSLNKERGIIESSILGYEVALEGCKQRGNVVDSAQGNSAAEKKHPL